MLPESSSTNITFGFISVLVELAIGESAIGTSAALLVTAQA